jgi:cytochrome c biogenesis protein CcdA
MNDNELDNLISETFQRKEVLDDIGQNVMQNLQRDTRHARLRRWARILAFSFGFPLVALFLLLPAYYFASTFDNVALKASMAFYAIIIITVLVKISNDFSPEDV